MPTQDARKGQHVRFLWDDPFGLWREGDVALDLGWESDHPEAPHIRALRFKDDQVITIQDPYTRGIVESADGAP